MCGIVGRVHTNQSLATIDEHLLRSMRDAMIHRGPDDGGLWVSMNQNVGMAHRRLSIIDLSTVANQPMLNDDQSIGLVFNGEIYNHAEIRKELERLGARFRTDHSDTEVILRSYEQWGIDAIERFRGMFAFALWDEYQQCLWLVRDRIGIKPIYYTLSQGVFSFASEIKALLKDATIKPRLNEQALFHYLSFLTTPAPATLFEGIHKLPPSTILKLSMDGVITTRRWWNPWKHAQPLVGMSEQDVIQGLMERLRESVRLRKVSDVPVGIFLSGGIDSSTNAALFSEGEHSIVKTFSVSYGDQVRDYPNELPYARRVADFLHTDHYEHVISQDEALEFIPQMIWHQDEPIGDPVCIPVYFVSKLARENGVVVAQLGEGSDELFWGYEFWKRMGNLETWNQRFPWMLPKKLLHTLLSAAGRRGKWDEEWLRRAIHRQPVFWGGAEAFTHQEKYFLASQRLCDQWKGKTSWEAVEPWHQEYQSNAWEQTPLSWMSHIDLRMRLPELLLMRVDKMSMAVALEARVPFLDHRVVEYALSIPTEMKMRNGELKYILKKAVAGIIPNNIISRKKVGFGAPLDSWFGEALGERMRKTLREFTLRTDILNPSAIDALIRHRQAHHLWFLYNFVLWHERWIEG